MIKFVTFASGIRWNRAACCSAWLVLGAFAAQRVHGQEVAAATVQADFSLRGYDPEQGQGVRGSFEESMIVPVTAYHYYVAPDGADWAAGTRGAPFRTLARAASAATRPGTTVHVAEGSYEGGFKTSGSGTAANRIYWVSSVKWGAKIVPPAKSSGNVAWDNRGNYVSIIGFDVDGSRPREGVQWTHGIYTGGAYGAIAENKVHHIATSGPCTTAGGSGIGVDAYYHGVQTDVLSNMVHDIGPAGCRYVQGIYMSTSGNVKNNIVYRVSEAGIHLWHDAHNVVVSNNTVAASDTGIVIGGGDFYYNRSGNDHTMVYSNVVYDNKVGISEQGKTGTGNAYRNNLVYQNAVNWKLQNGLKHSGTVSSAPYFVAYDRKGTPDFRPGASSPMVGRGTVQYAHPSDFAGRPRNDKTGFDIGALQHP